MHRVTQLTRQGSSVPFKHTILFSSVCKKSAYGLSGLRFCAGGCEKLQKQKMNGLLIF